MVKRDFNIALVQVNCVKKDEIINGKFISSIFFPNCEEDDTSYYSATILEFVANGAKEQTDCWFEVKLSNFFLPLSVFEKLLFRYNPTHTRSRQS